jgi:type 1 glutamine amidotransferase
VAELVFVTEVAPYRDGVAGAHGVLPQAVRILRQLAQIEGLAFRHVDDVAQLPVAALESARVLALFTIGETPWSEAQRDAIARGVRSGSTGFLPLHSASDACYGWPDYGRLVGARFDGHPWTQELGVEIVDPTHPATRHLGAGWRTTDEVYLFRELRPDAHILLRARVADLDPEAPGARVPAIGLPLAWCHREGQGRVFYTALGHFPALYEQPRFIAHIQGGLRWVLGPGG